MVFCLDRAGLVGDDGPTHHGCYDIAYFRCIPNMIISAPMNESELRNLMYTSQLESMQLPIVIRYPRGEGMMPEWRTEMKEIVIGTGRRLREGKEIAILSFGHPGNFAAAAIRDLRNEGINPRVRPLAAARTTTAYPTQATHTMTNWPAPMSTRAKDSPSRRKAATPSWIISSINTSAPATQNVYG